jgi:hypothetical protein
MAKGSTQPLTEMSIRKTFSTTNKNLTSSITKSLFHISLFMEILMHEAYKSYTRLKISEEGNAFTSWSSSIEGFSPHYV